MTRGAISANVEFSDAALGHPKVTYGSNLRFRVCGWHRPSRQLQAPSPKQNKCNFTLGSVASQKHLHLRYVLGMGL